MKSVLFACVGALTVSLLAGCEATPPAQSPVDLARIAAALDEPAVGETTLTAATLAPIAAPTQLAQWEDVEPPQVIATQTWGVPSETSLPDSPY